MHEAAPPERPVIRHGLPQDITAFTGRERELARLLALTAPSRVTNVHTVDGMPGVGKTALVTRAAHMLTGRFPDGQFFCDLHAHTPGMSPAKAIDVLAVLLTDLGLDPRNLPPTVEGRSDLWRDRLVGRRVLLVLDDAAGHAQIKPLLPGGPGCLTLVTSRRRLIALDGADPLSLPPLAPSEAAELFTKAAHRTPTGSEHTAVAQVVRLCGRLPLAIVLLAGRLRHKDKWSITRFTAEFTDAQDRLSEVVGEDRAAHSAFALSYQDLPDDQQRLFRRIGLHPGPDLDAYAAAALDGIPLASARRRLEALYTDHLLEEITPGRYQPHDLLRAYARTLVTDRDPPDDRTRAVERLLLHYLHTAQRADRHLARIPRLENPSVVAQFAAPELRDHTDALAWMRTERANLLACIDTATPDQAPHAVRLTAALAAFLLQNGSWHQAATLHRRAATAAHDHNDPHGEADALHELGCVRYLTGDNTEAARLQQQALALYEALGDRLGQANVLSELGRGQGLSGHYEQAARLHEQALTLYECLGNRHGQAHVLNTLGRMGYVTGDYEQADQLHERALALYAHLGNEHGQAQALHGLGRVRCGTGHHEQAARLHAEALTLFESVSDRLGQAQALHGLGHVRYVTGDHKQATRLHTRALALFESLGNQHGQAHAIHDLGRALQATGDHEQATQLHQRALALFQGIGDRMGQAQACHGLGRVHYMAGDYEQAASLQQKALTLFQEVGAPQGEAEVLNDIGALLAESTGPEAALTPYRQAMGLARRIRSPLDEARALEGAARCLARMGDHDGAQAELRQALAIYRRTGAAEAQSAAEYLATLVTPKPRGH
ncbi:ATP-binding protein [Streptomyces atriruber]|uniref:ATP-binding protein n=1 Tax=Streptomyces atriruber TaxID=545121 RepID=UPI001428C5BC|nr:tetratricopeptide repeat protein [Streptomyces atriruber]